MASREAAPIPRASGASGATGAGLEVGLDELMGDAGGASGASGVPSTPSGLHGVSTSGASGAPGTSSGASGSGEGPSGASGAAGSQMSSFPPSLPALVALLAPRGPALEGIARRSPPYRPLPERSASCAFGLRRASRRCRACPNPDTRSLWDPRQDDYVEDHGMQADRCVGYRPACHMMDPRVRPWIRTSLATPHKGSRMAAIRDGIVRRARALGGYGLRGN